MQRRNFIRNTLLASGALALPIDSRAVAEAFSMSKSIPTFKKSIMWGTVGLKGSVLDKCKAIKMAGYAGIQPNSHLDRKEVLDALKSTGLVASDVCCSTHWDKQLSHPDATIRQEGIEGVIVAMEDAKAYGTDAILVVPGSVSDTVAYDECWERSSESIRKLLPTAEKLKIKICIENVWNNFLLTPLDACRYIDQFKSKYAGFYFDCGNILAFGWPEQWIRILGARTVRIHIKEFSKQKADREGRWAGFDVKLTEGDVNWEKVMKEARKSYSGEWFTTEQGNSQTQEELIDLNKRLDKILQM
ncbi:MAG: sugar phosphate isomerase/epimerase [Bacteroidales bacterium]|jgi:hexulose-6-phosphate isomerase|nr:sugar phosphate isomerase/epimerase [Bacteroidales bacterium]